MKSPRSLQAPKVPGRAWVTLALLLLTVLLWIATSVSNRVYDVSLWKLNISSEFGGLFFRYLAHHTSLREYQGIHGFFFFGFQAYRTKYAHASNYTLVIPDWAIAAVLMIFLWRQLRSWWKARKVFARIAAGHCANCGYDLRGSQERCPECGVVPDELLSKPPRDRQGGYLT